MPLQRDRNVIEQGRNMLGRCDVAAKPAKGGHALVAYARDGRATVRHRAPADGAPIGGGFRKRFPSRARSPESAQAHHGTAEDDPRPGAQTAEERLAEADHDVEHDRRVDCRRHDAQHDEAYKGDAHPAASDEGGKEHAGQHAARRDDRHQIIAHPFAGEACLFTDDGVPQARHMPGEAAQSEDGEIACDNSAEEGHQRERPRQIPVGDVSGARDERHALMQEGRGKQRKQVQKPFTADGEKHIGAIFLDAARTASQLQSAQSTTLRAACLGD